MKRAFTGLFMLMAGSLLVVQLAGANAIAGKVCLFGELGYSMYAMEQFNEQVDLMNELIEAMGLTTDGINKLNGGLTFGGGVMYGLMSNLLVGLEIDYLTAASKGEGEASGDIMGITYSVSMDMKASAGALLIGPVIKYAMPMGDKLLLTGGIGLDYASVSGSTKIETTMDMMGITDTTTEEEKMSGSGMGFKILVGGEMFVNPMISVGADLGYRILKITELEDEDGEVIEVADEDGNLENMELDYSGLIIKGGVKLYF